MDLETGPVQSYWLNFHRRFKVCLDSNRLKVICSHLNLRNSKTGPFQRSEFKSLCVLWSCILNVRLDEVEVSIRLLDLQFLLWFQSQFLHLYNFRFHLKNHSPWQYIQYVEHYISLTLLTECRWQTCLDPVKLLTACTRQNYTDSRGKSIILHDVWFWSLDLPVRWCLPTGGSSALWYQMLFVLVKCIKCNVGNILKVVLIVTCVTDKHIFFGLTLSYS